MRHLTLEEGVKQVGWKCFRNQSALDRIDFPESLEWVHAEAFDGTSWFKYKPLGEVYCGNVLYRYKGQSGSDGSVWAIIPDIYIKDGTKSVSTYCFSKSGNSGTFGIKGVKNVIFNDGLIGIGDSAFVKLEYNDDKATVFSKIPDTVTWIGKRAFYGTNAKINIPKYLDKIQSGSYSHCNLGDIVIPSSVRIIEDSAFSYSNISSVEFEEGIERLSTSCFSDNNIKELKIPSTVKSIESSCFSYNYDLESVYLPNSIIDLAQTAFNYCTGLKDVVVEEGFSAECLDISASTLYTKETLENIIDSLADKTNLCPSRFIVGSTNLAKISSEKIAEAVAKNWTIS